MLLHTLHRLLKVFLGQYLAANDITEQSTNRAQT